MLKKLKPAQLYETNSFITCPAKITATSDETCSKIIEGLLKASEQGKNAQEVCRSSPINGNYLLTDYTENYRRSNRKTKQKPTREIFALKKIFKLFDCRLKKLSLRKRCFNIQ